MNRDPFHEAVGGLLSAPENVAKMQEIIDLAVEHAHLVFKYGTSAEKTRLSNALFASAARNAQQARQSELEQQMRKDYESLRASVQQSIPDTLKDEPGEQKPEQEPEQYTARVKGGAKAKFSTERRR